VVVVGGHWHVHNLIGDIKENGTLHDEAKHQL